MHVYQPKELVSKSLTLCSATVVVAAGAYA